MVTVTGNTSRLADAGTGERPSDAPARNRDDRPEAATGNHPDRNRGARRHPRTIRFSHSEWALVEQAAARLGLTPAELIRSCARAIAEQRLPEQAPASLSPGHLALIEATYRATHLLATLATRNLHYQEIDDLVAAAHNAMLEASGDRPDRTVRDQAPAVRRRQTGRSARHAGNLLTALDALRRMAGPRSPEGPERDGRAA